MKKTLTFPGIYPILMLFILSAACQESTSADEKADTLMELDRQFSRESEENGVNAAIRKYIDDDAVILRANRHPVLGREKIIELYTNPDRDFVLTWEPSFAYVSKSGDLGYTYGIYKTESLSPEGEEVINHGTYVTIWKKDAEGNWKFVLDTGNSGLERKKPDLEN